MSITFNSNLYNVGTITCTSYYGNKLDIASVSAPVTPPANSLVLFANTGSSLGIQAQNNLGGLIVPRPVGNFDLVVPENNAEITCNVNTQTLSNKTIDYSNNTIDVNYLRDIPVNISNLTNTYIQYNSILGSWGNSTYVGAGTTYPYWTFSDTKSLGTSGGVSNGGFINRTINLIPAQSSTNTAVTNPTSTTISFNQVGSYYVHALSVVRGTSTSNFAKLYLADSTTPTTYYLSGLSGSVGPENQTLLLLGVIKVPTAPIVCTLRCYNSFNGANGLGLANSITGTNEVYTSMHIRKISNSAA